jgi:Tol biopolymer transport system component
MPAPGEVMPRSGRLVIALSIAVCAAAMADEKGGELYAAALQPAGPLSSHADIGAVRTPGTVQYDAYAQAYALSGSGRNMWFGEDEFFFVYRKLEGDFILSANTAFAGAGVDPHRKAGWMVRTSLEADAPYVDAALHGDGLAALQFRRAPGADTEERRSPVAAPSVLQLAREGNSFVMSVAREGEPLERTVLENLSLPDELYVGVFVCAHDPEAVERARFSNLRVSIPAPQDFRPYQDYYPSRLEVMDVGTGQRRVVHTEADSMQAPNWTPDGAALVFNRNGKLYRLDIETGQVAAIDTGFADRNNNDHAISFDGRMLARSHHAEAHDGESIIYTLPVEGGVPKQVSPEGPSYFHGWSPDGQWLVYTGGRNGNYDIFKILASGGAEEVRLTNDPALDDGAEFAPDGQSIWFNSARSGRMEIWRMRPDGSAEEQVTDDRFNNWFPHISPDGRQLVYLAYGPEVAAEDHPWYRHVYLMLRPVAGGKSRVVAYLYGGQGTINVPSWSPDSKSIAFVSN